MAAIRKYLPILGIVLIYLVFALISFELSPLRWRPQIQMIASLWCFGYSIGLIMKAITQFKRKVK